MTSTLYRRGIKPTYVELLKEGREMGLLKSAHDQEELRYVVEQFIDDENIRYWIGKVKEASKGRKLQKLLKKYVTELKDENPDISSIVKEASGDFFSLAVDSDEEKIVTAKELAEIGEKAYLERIDKYRKMQEDCKALGEFPLEGVPTGFKTLDRMSLGYKPGDLIILAAQTGHGKTAFAIQTSSSVCIDGGKPLYYINTEMKQLQLAQRWGAVLSGIPMQQIRGGSSRDDQKPQCLAAYKALSRAGFYTSYLPNLTPIKADIFTRKAKMQFNVEMMILDYVGRMEKIDPKLQEWQVLEQIVKSMKQLAQNLDIAVMVLIQLTEEGYLQGSKRMKNEADLMLKLIPVADQEAMNKIQERTGNMYEPFNYRIFVEKARDSASNVSIPIVYDLEKQQLREAMIIGTYQR